MSLPFPVRVDEGVDRGGVVPTTDLESIQTAFHVDREMLNFCPFMCIFAIFSLFW